MRVFRAFASGRTAMGSFSATLGARIAWKRPEFRWRISISDRNPPAFSGLFQGFFRAFSGLFLSGLFQGFFRANLGSISGDPFFGILGLPQCCVLLDRNSSRGPSQVTNTTSGSCRNSPVSLALSTFKACRWSLTPCLSGAPSTPSGNTPDDDSRIFNARYE